MLVTEDMRAAIFNPRMLICVFTGFVSGLPLLLLLHMVPAWLTDGGVSLTEIALFSLMGLPYAWKFLWAPFMDRYVPPFLGRRRGWMLVTQVGLFLAIGMMGSLDPRQSLYAIAVFALIVAFLGASQDVALDAYRREILPDHELGLGNAVHVNAYRLAILVPGSLGLVLADSYPWAVVFWVVAAFMFVGVGLSLLVKEPPSALPPAAGVQEAVTAPFREYLQRRGWSQLVLILAFLVLYKLGDSMATALSTPFYLDLGFTKTDIGLIAKQAALWPSIIGGLLGGLLMLRIGINKALWLFGLVQLLSILGFAVLAEAGALKWLLAVVIGFEYLGVGLGTAAFVAFIARETSLQYAATQFALFTALAAIPRTVVNATTGVIVESVGWTEFFILCAVLAIPGMVLLRWVAPWSGVGDRLKSVPRT
jgi:PAT family beta-lactamase induction signal transducer AmpG